MVQRKTKRWSTQLQIDRGGRHRKLAGGQVHIGTTCLHGGNNPLVARERIGVDGVRHNGERTRPGDLCHVHAGVVHARVHLGTERRDCGDLVERHGHLPLLAEDRVLDTNERRHGVAITLAMRATYFWTYALSIIQRADSVFCTAPII